MVDAERHLRVPLRGAQSASTEAACGEAFQRGRLMQPQYPCINTVPQTLGSAASAFTERAFTPVFHLFFSRPCFSRRVVFPPCCDVTDGCASHRDQKGACVNLISFDRKAGLRIVLVLSFRTFLPSPSPQASLPENDIRFPSTLIKSCRLVAPFRITMYMWDPGCLVSKTCGWVLYAALNVFFLAVWTNPHSANAGRWLAKYRGNAMECSRR
jgi:hypothetical protein